MERDAALADFDAAREEWEVAFGRVPDAALTYLKPGDDYSLGGLQVHVNWVLEHYHRVLMGIAQARFEKIGPQDRPGAEQKARDAARRGLTPQERRKTLEEMGRLHAAVITAARKLDRNDWSRKAPVVYGEGEDAFPTCADDIVGWLREHYREHVEQSANLIEEWQGATAGG